MKQILFYLTLFYTCNTILSQSIKIETGNTGTKDDFYSGISRVYNNKVYVATYLGDKVTITGFDANSMKKLNSFTTDNIKRLKKNGVLFIENNIIIIHEEKKNTSTILGDVFNYEGKLIEKDKVLHDFSVLDNDGVRRSGSNLTSENGKYFMLSSNSKSGEAGFEYILYDNSLKLISKAVIKFPKEYKETYIKNIILSNTGNIGAFIYEEGEKTNFSYCKLMKGNKTIEMVKTLSENYLPQASKLIVSRKGYYIGGTYGTVQERKVLKLQGTQFEYTVYGAFGIKLNIDNLSIEYENFTDFSTENAEAYNNEFEKNPNLKGVIDKYDFSRERIFNFYYGFPELHIDGMAVDKNDNIALSLSSYKTPYSETDKFTMNMIICQFKLNSSGGISNFKIIPKRQQVYNSFFAADYFFSSLVCSADKMVSIFNDDENNISNLTDMNKNITDVGKKSLLASAETNANGSFKKYVLLPDDKDVLIFTAYTLFIDHNLSFAIATRDKSEVVLLKISSVE